MLAVETKWGASAKTARQWAEDGRDHIGILLTSDTGMPRGADAVSLYLKTLAALLKDNPAKDAFHNQVCWLKPE